MNAINEASEKVTEFQTVMEALTRKQSDLSAVLAPLEKQKVEVVAHGGPLGKKTYRDLFDKIGDLNYERERLDLETTKAKVALAAARTGLKSAKDEQAARLQEHMQRRENERLQNLERSLPDELEKLAAAYFEVCCMAGRIQLEGSRFTETGGATVSSGIIAKFFADLPYCIEEKFKKGFVPCPRAWPFEVVFRGMLRTDGSFQDFPSALHTEQDRRTTESRKEFLKNENT